MRVCPYISSIYCIHKRMMSLYKSATTTYSRGSGQGHDIPTPVSGYSSGSDGVHGVSIIAYTILGVPFYNSGIMGLKPYSNSEGPYINRLNSFPGVFRSPASDMCLLT